MKLLVSQQHK